MRRTMTALLPAVALVGTTPAHHDPHLPTLAEALALASADGLTSDPTAVSWGSGRIDVFARGPDNALWHRWYSGSWSGWESLGGSLAGGPDVASWGSGRLDVFARGTDNTLQHKWYGGQWSGWESLGGGLTSDPSAVSWGPGRLDVFARGTDNGLWHIWYASGWSGWESLGGALASGPDASSWGAGRLDVFARGKDNTLQHKWYSGQWSGWQSLGGGLTSDPSAVSWSSGRIDVFARGTDNALWHIWYANSWSGWESLGGGLTSGPDASSWGSGRLDVFARGLDNALYHRWYAGGWSGWEGLGAPAVATTTTILKTGTLSSTTYPAQPTYAPPGTYPPVSLAIKSWNPSLHQVTWNTDGVHGYAYFQVYKRDATSPSGRLVRDRLNYLTFWDTSFVAPNTTTYRIVGYQPDGTWGSADIAYPTPPQPVAPGGFNGVQVSGGAVKFSWQTLPGATRYRLFGPTLPADGLPVGSQGVSNLPASYVVTGLPVGTLGFSIATEYLAGVATARASTSVTVKPTSGRYRVLVKGLLATHETADDPLSFDGKYDEIYVAVFSAALPFYRGAAPATSLVQTRVYGDVNHAPERIQAGTASPSGGIMTGNMVPDGTAPIAQASISTFTDRFPLLVWQGTLQDSGQILVIHPTIWESDRNATGNFLHWRDWWFTSTGSAVLKDVAYTNQFKDVEYVAKYGAAAAPINPVWLGEWNNSWPVQPGMDVGQGQDRPVGIGGGEGALGIVAPTANLNSLAPMGLILTREKIERALALSGLSAILIPVSNRDRPELAGEYAVFIQIERLP